MKPEDLLINKTDPVSLFVKELVRDYLEQNKDIMINTRRGNKSFKDVQSGLTGDFFSIFFITKDGREIYEKNINGEVVEAFFENVKFEKKINVLFFSMKCSLEEKMLTFFQATVPSVGNISSLFERVELNEKINFLERHNNRINTQSSSDDKSSELEINQRAQVISALRERLSLVNLNSQAQLDKVTKEVSQIMDEFYTNLASLKNAHVPKNEIGQKLSTEHIKAKLGGVFHELREHRKKVNKELYPEKSLLEKSIRRAVSFFTSKKKRLPLRQGSQNNKNLKKKSLNKNLRAIN